MADFSLFGPREPPATPNSVVVRISDFHVTNDTSLVIITHALGSCIAVTAYDPVRQIGGMIHYLRPLSKSSPQKARERPATFADTGVPLLFHKLYELGAKKDRLIVKVAGGATRYDESAPFDIGGRNYRVLCELFRRAGVTIASEDVGGCVSRTVSLNMSTGMVLVRSPNGEREL